MGRAALRARSRSAVKGVAISTILGILIGAALGYVYGIVGIVIAIPVCWAVGTTVMELLE